MSDFPNAILILAILVGAIWWSLIHRRQASDGRKRLPPGPPKLPVSKYLSFLGGLNNPHRVLRGLSSVYGPIMSLRYGGNTAVILSSPEAAKLFLKTHETNFLSRPTSETYNTYHYGPKGMVYVVYSEYWRSVRKLFTVELVSAARVVSFRDMRMEEIELAVESLRAAPPGEAVDLSDRAQRLIEDITSRMLFGRRKNAHLMDAVHELSSLIVNFSMYDYVPYPVPLHLQALYPRLKVLKETVDQMLESIIDEREEEEKRETATNQPHRKDFIGVLLALINNKSGDKKSSSSEDVSYSNIDRDGVKAIVLDTIIGAVDTSSTAIEWIMTELLRHPRVMTKVQEEINRVVGQDRMVGENDLSEFIYLEMVIKEALRLHPVIPMLAPRQSIEDIVINDYFIPKNSIILVNYWAIGRDPNLWSKNAEDFLPERFLDNEIDFRGHHFHFIPFGAGRRGCPAVNLAMITIRFVVAQLVHCFNWKLPNGMPPTELDVKERFGLSLARANHLLAVPKFRLSI